MRTIELKHANLIISIDKERLIRRTKQWCLRVIPIYKKYTRNEEEKQINQSKLHVYHLTREQLIKKQQKFLQDIKLVDKKWIDKGNEMGQKKLKDLQDFSMLKYNPKYNMNNTYKMTREHPL